MARLKRLSVPHVPHHIIQRGNNRQPIFFAEEDYALYLDKLKYYAKEYEVLIHSFVLMTNHIHLLCTPTTENGLSKLFQSLGRFYVLYVNRTYHRTGGLWEGRFKSTLVDDEKYFLTVSRYIELNPVRAKMVDHPAEYPWSSYHGNVGLHEIPFLTPHRIYKSLGDDIPTQQQVYASLFEQIIPEKTLDEIRNMTNRGWVLGSDKFKKEIEKMTGRAASPALRGGDRKSVDYKR